MTEPDCTKSGKFKNIIVGDDNKGILNLSGKARIEGKLSVNDNINSSGNIVLTNTNTYINFSNVLGNSGFGIKNEDGYLKFKNSNGSWKSIGTACGGISASITSGAVCNRLVLFSGTETIDGSDNLTFDGKF